MTKTVNTKGRPLGISGDVTTGEGASPERLRWVGVRTTRARGWSCHTPAAKADRCTVITHTKVMAKSELLSTASL